MGFELREYFGKRSGLAPATQMAWRTALVFHQLLTFERDVRTIPSLASTVFLKLSFSALTNPLSMRKRAGRRRSVTIRMRALIQIAMLYVVVREDLVLGILCADVRAQWRPDIITCLSRWAVPVARIAGRCVPAAFRSANVRLVLQRRSHIRRERAAP
jgi:hypothetical protein